MRFHLAQLSMTMSIVALTDMAKFPINLIALELYPSTILVHLLFLL